MIATNRNVRVAVLEDDAIYRDDILVPALQAQGFHVESFGRPLDLYRRMLATSFDVVVLDVGLPDEDGLSVARHLRAGSPLGLIMLTGRDDTGERVRILEETVDAWLSKPVDTDIVAATVRSLARRIALTPDAPPARSDSVVAAAPSRGWRFNYETWRLHSPCNREVVLTHPERQVLSELFSAAGETVMRERLIAALASAPEAFDPHRLEMLIHRLRRKVRDQLGLPLPLQTVRGIGYVLIVEGAAR